jgi:hypothetical protein
MKNMFSFLLIKDSRYALAHTLLGMILVLKHQNDQAGAEHERTVALELKNVRATAALTCTLDFAEEA